MRSCLAVLALALSGSAGAGEIYGSITRGGQAVANEPIKVECSGGARAPDGTPSTDRYGAYRLAIAGEGPCTLTLQGVAPASVRAYAAAQRYNFEVRTVDGRARLEQR